VSAALFEFACGSCGSLCQVEAQLRATACPYCASPAVIERPHDPSRPAPLFVIAFVVVQAVALDAARRWVKRAFFAPEAFRAAEVAAIRGIYVPAYLFSAAAEAEYSAEIGENYTVTTTDSKGRTRTRTETEWSTLSGRYSAYISDVLVTASRGVHNHELEAIEPFDLRALHRYTPRLLSGWIAEEASRAADECQRLAVEESMAVVQRRIAAMLPGDKHRGLRVSSTLRGPHQQLMLLPVWVLPVRYKRGKEDQVVRLLVNGQTGEVGGAAPRSWPKIIGLIVVILGLIVGGYFLIAHR